MGLKTLITNPKELAEKNTSRRNAHAKEEVANNLARHLELFWVGKAITKLIKFEEHWMVDPTHESTILLEIAEAFSELGWHLGFSRQSTRDWMVIISDANP